MVYHRKFTSGAARRWCLFSAVPLLTSRCVRYIRLEDGHAACRYTVVICGNNLLRDRGKVSDPQKVPQRCTRRSAVRVWRAAFTGNIVNIDGAKIDAPAHQIRAVRHRRMKLCPGEDDGATRRDDKAHVRIEFQRFLRVRLYPGIAAYVLGRILTTLSIPSVVVEVT